MQLAMVVLPTDGSPACWATRSTLVDTFWLAARPSDGVEHIAVRMTSNSIVVGVYLNAPSGADPAVTARALTERARTTSPILRDHLL